MNARNGSFPGSVDPLDALIVQHLERDPTLSFAALARELGREGVEAGEKTIARRYARMSELGLLRVRARTLPGFQGRLAWLLRIAMPAEPRGQQAQVGAWLARQPWSRWVRRSLAGDELLCGVISGANPDAPVFSALLGNPRVSGVEPYQLLQIWSHSRSEEATEWPGMELDEVDRRIIAQLSEDGRRPHRIVAKAVGVDPATVSRRVKRLVESGVVYYELDYAPEVYGVGVDAMLWLRMAPGRVRALGEALRDNPACRFAAATTGRENMVLNVFVSSQRELVRFVDEDLAGFGVSSYRVVPVGRTLKRGG